MTQTTVMTRVSRRVLVLSAILFYAFIAAQAQTTAFTYQGRLSDGANPANGAYQMQFALYDVNNVQQPQPAPITITLNSVGVVNGVFTVSLDFGGSAFTSGGDRFLEIRVFSTATSGYVTLTPHQQLTSSPYSIRTISAGAADSLSNVCVGCVDDAKISTVSGSKVTGTVANATTADSATSFSGSLGGDVTGTQSATVVGKVGGQTAASIANATTTINNATNANTANAIVKRDAAGNFSAGTITATTFSGNATTADTATSFSGSLVADVTGTQKATVVSKVGGQSAASVATATTAANNATSANTASAIVKRDATGNFSAGTITGSLSGNATSATNATQLGGVAANQYVQTGDSRLSDARPPTAGSTNYVQNTASPQTADFNITGNGKAGGTLSGNSINASTQYNLNGNRAFSAGGNQNLFVGIDAGSANSGIANTFIGSNAGPSNTSASFNSFVGTNAGALNSADYNSFFGSAAGAHNTWGDSNSFVGASAGGLNTTGASNSFFGAAAGFNSKTGSHNTAIGTNADFGAVDLDYATAIGADSNVSTSNTIVLGRSNGSDKVRIFGLGTAGSAQLCRNSNNEISSCSSSLRYKTNIATFTFGLNLINQLQPITFDWKTGGMKDVGFGAEDVARVNPLFVTYNAKGEVEGVKYDRLGAVFVNAIKEQQTQIQQQQRQIQTQLEKLKTQQEQIDALRKLVCLDHPNAPICK